MTITLIFTSNGYTNTQVTGGASISTIEALLHNALYVYTSKAQGTAKELYSLLSKAYLLAKIEAVSEAVLFSAEKRIISYEIAGNEVKLCNTATPKEDLYASIHLAAALAVQQEIEYYQLARMLKASIMHIPVSALS